MTDATTATTGGARPELLAPAGDAEALRAAVANGADAVYFGLEGFNARRRATNFTLAGLPEVMADLHAHNVKGYVTVNTLVFEDELGRAVEYAEGLAAAGADAAIVQDLGVARLLRRMVPKLELHASTQMTQTDAPGIEWLRERGVRRVILARELALAEIAAIARATPMPLEVFVHGALCISYSGQCLASEALHGRSANRGLCAQACRLPYELLVDGRVQRDDRRYPLSPQDLAAYERVAELVRLGVAAFKIEGRLKSPHYVAVATQTYRAAIDAALANRPFRLSAEQQAELAQSFSRGWTHGFLDGVNHQQLVEGRCPKKRGVQVGRVVGRTAGGVVVEFGAGMPAPVRGAKPAWPVKPGDGVVFDEGHPEQDEQGGRVYEVKPAGGPRRAELAFGRGGVNLAAIGAGALVWKTDDPALRKRLERSYSRDKVVRPMALRAIVTGVVGRPLRVRLETADGRTVEVESAEALQAAERHPLSVTRLREQFGRLGDTPFELGAVELRDANGPTDPCGVMAPKSVLNDMRRRAVQQLLELGAQAARRAVVEADALEKLRVEARGDANAGPPAESSRPRLAVLVRSREQLEAVVAWCPPTGVECGRVYADLREVGDYGWAVQTARAAGRAIALATPRVLMPNEEGLLEQIVAARPDGVLVRSLGALQVLRQAAPELALVADFGLNAANALAAQVLREAGVAVVTPSLDLSGRQLAGLLADFPAADVEVPLHLHVPLFHTRHCLYAANLSDGARCGDCGWRCESHEVALRDRNGVTHPVRTDALRRNVVYNGAAQSAAELVAGLAEQGVRQWRVELLGETAEQSRALLGAYGRLLGGMADAAEVLAEVQAAGGSVTRGTWAFD
jgi:putative protease